MYIELYATPPVFLLPLLFLTRSNNEIAPPPSDPRFLRIPDLTPHNKTYFSFPDLDYQSAWTPAAFGADRRSKESPEVSTYNF